MPSPELQNVIDLLIQSREVAPENPSIEDSRAGFDALSQMFPPPEGTITETAVIAGMRAEWVRGPGATDDATVLYLHGGGYAIGSLESHRGLIARLSAACGVRFCAVDYRLAPEHPHPAAVDDGVAAYRALLDQGIAAARLAIAGDSAGGGLTIATLVAARDAGLPMPAAAAVLSPWLDLEGTGESRTTRADVDPVIPNERLKELAEYYLAGQDARAPLASPIYADLRGLPPVLVHVGDAEVLLSDSTTFAERAREAGVDVTLEVWPEMIHVWHLFGAMAPEGRDATAKVGAYLRERLRG